MSDSQIEVVPLPYYDLTLSQKKFLALMWKVSGFFSIWGSCYILFDIFGSNKNRSEKLPLMYYRIMVAISVFDLFGSIFISMLSTAPIPSDSPNSSIVWGNIGSTETCDAQAILTQFTAIGAIFYTTILSLYFWLFISRSWNESKLRKVEPCLHAFTLLFCIISSTVLYIREVTNHGIFFCWINSVPINCEKDDNVECIRGEEVFFYRTAFLIIPIVISFLLINFFMISLYLTFRRQASIMQRYSSTPGSVGRSSLNLDSEDEGGKLNFRTIVSNAICCFSGTSSMDEGPMTLKSRKVFYKALAFIGAFFVVWSPVAVVTLMAQISNKNLFWVLALESVITPLNGFFNVLIYENTSPLTFFIRSLTRLRSMIFLKNTQEVDSDHSELHLFTDNSNEMEMNEMEVATSVTEKVIDTDHSNIWSNKEMSP